MYCIGFCIFLFFCDECNCKKIRTGPVKAGFGSGCGWNCGGWGCAGREKLNVELGEANQLNNLTFLHTLKRE